METKNGCKHNSLVNNEKVIYCTEEEAAIHPVGAPEEDFLLLPITESSQREVLSKEKQVHFIKSLAGSFIEENGVL